ncbi:MAG: aromatic amino acid lyase [Xanthomonadales bacterium PRO6]|nr:aromatic amino acid lyase [Xanthomonadales bacterium PRO6]
MELDGRRLSIEAVQDIAHCRRPVRLSRAALKRVQASADFLARELKRGEPIYGVTTGFGSNADRLLENTRRRARTDGEQLSTVAELQRNLIISHAVCVGTPLPPPMVRAMLAIRINTLLQGHSGVRVVTLERLLELLRLDLVPVVPEKGSVGASGDLAPLSHLALAVIGEGEVYEAGVRVPAREALARNGLEPLTLSFKEGLALNNGTGQMLASAILALERFSLLSRQADINAALALEAFCGRSAAFDERVHALRPHPGQIAAAANIRRLVAGSSLVDIPYHRVPRFAPWSAKAWAGADGDKRTFDVRWDYIPPGERGARARWYQRNLPFRGGKKVQPQDAYSLRCAPQVHGAVKDTLTRVREIVEIELNSVTDNPIVFAQVEEDQDTVVSAGNFHGMPIALALTQLKCAIPVLASISERRLAKLVDPATNDGLPPFLIGNEDGTDSGHMIVQYTAAALVNELATKAHPATVYSVPTSANAEDHVSMGTTEARHVLEMLGDLEKVLALELLVATQALEFRQQILAASYSLASLGTQALRSKLRNLSQVTREESVTLAEDVKRLQADLRKLEDTHPARPGATVLELVRRRGITFMAHDRLLAPDIEAIVALVESGEVVAAVESVLGAPLL